MEVQDAEVVKFTPKYKFIHLRFHDYYGKVLNLGGVTIAYQADAESIRYGIACCSVQDNFFKKVGRALATERIRDGGSIPTIQGRDTRDIIEDHIVPLAYQRFRNIRGGRKALERAASGVYVPVGLTDTLY